MAILSMLEKQHIDNLRMNKKQMLTEQQLDQALQQEEQGYTRRETYADVRVEPELENRHRQQVHWAVLKLRRPIWRI